MVARVALTWPLVAAALAVSWVVVRRSLPAGHPGLRHPVTRDGDAGPLAPARAGRIGRRPGRKNKGEAATGGAASPVTYVTPSPVRRVIP